MADPKAHLNAELARLASLTQSIAGLALPEDDRDLLAELVSAHADAARNTWLTERLDQAVALLFPDYDSLKPEHLKPVRWPSRAWWWNSARIRDTYVQANGDVIVNLRSYVGRGETDDLDQFRIHREWLEAEDMAAVIHQACRAQAERLAQAARAAQRAQAQAQIAAAHAQLAALEGANV